MVRELLILRHGHANDVGEGGDKARELKDKGKRDAQRIGVWMAQKDLLPDRVVASPAKRAVRTAEKAMKAAGLWGGVVVPDDRVHENTDEALLDAIHATSAEVRRLLLVGHNPGLEIIVAALAENVVRLRPATLVHLGFDGEWPDLGPGGARIVRAVNPDDLPRDFPYPMPDGRAFRARPAYYYRQSSVIPFRWSGTDLEVLIISSSKKKHWVVPKGINDPGMSLQESAANEAMEEAGVKGRVLDIVVGTYRYPKWGAHCDVTVYPMEVTEVIPESAWEESYRGRRWVSVGKASRLVRNDDVKRIVAMLPDVLKTAR